MATKPPTSFSIRVRESLNELGGFGHGGVAHAQFSWWRRTNRHLLRLIPKRQKIYKVGPPAMLDGLETPMKMSSL